MKAFIVGYDVPYSDNNFGNIRVFKNRIAAEMFVNKLYAIQKKLKLSEKIGKVSREDKDLFNKLGLTYEQQYSIEEIDFVEGAEETKDEIIGLINKLEL